MTTPADIAWVFGWSRQEVDPLAERLIAERKAQLAFLPELEAEVLIPRPWPGRAGATARVGRTS